MFRGPTAAGQKQKSHVLQLCAWWLPSTVANILPRKHNHHHLCGSHVTTVNSWFGRSTVLMFTRETLLNGLTARQIFWVYGQVQLGGQKSPTADNSVWAVGLGNLASCRRSLLIGDRRINKFGALADGNWHCCDADVPQLCFAHDKSHTDCHWRQSYSARIGRPTESAERSFSFCVQTKHKIMASSKQQETCNQRVIILWRKYINRRKHITTGAQHNADSADWCDTEGDCSSGNSSA